MGTGDFDAGGNPAMDYHLVQGGIEVLQVTSCHRTRDKLGHLTRMQTSPIYSSFVDQSNLYSSQSKIQTATFPPNALFVILTGIA